MKHLVHIPPCCKLCNLQSWAWNYFLKTQFQVKQFILKYTGYYKNLELASFCNLSVNINVIINFIHVSVHQSTKMRQNAILCKSKMRKFHAILLFFQNSTTRKVQITLKICSFKSLILHFYLNYSNITSKQLFAFRNIKLVLKNFTKTSWTNTFCETTLAKPPSLHKPGPVAWWENRNILSGKALPQTFGMLYINLELGWQSPKICSQMLLTFNQTFKNEEDSPLALPERPYILAHGPLAACPWMTELLETRETIPTFKPFQPFMMSSGTRKWS